MEDLIVDVVILGAGAVGMLVASYLSKDNRVTLVTRRQAQADTINQQGLHRINIDHSVERLTLNSSIQFPQLKTETIVIVAVKYGQLNSIYPLLNALNENIPLIFLQNGLAHYEEVLTLPQKNIAFGSCQFGAQVVNDFTVIHRGLGVLKLAVGRGNKELYSLLKNIEFSNFQIENVENAEQMLFEKALLNCFINPLTAILNVKNGYLNERESTLCLLELLFEEFKNAFPIEMENFHFDDVQNLCNKTATNTSSMLADMLNNRPTEVETIVGALIKKAALKGNKLPTLQTLYYLTKALEEKGVENM